MVDQVAPYKASAIAPVVTQRKVPLAATAYTFGSVVIFTSLTPGL